MFTHPPQFFLLGGGGDDGGGGGGGGGVDSGGGGGVDLRAAYRHVIVFFYSIGCIEKYRDTNTTTQHNIPKSIWSK